MCIGHSKNQVGERFCEYGADSKRNVNDFVGFLDEKIGIELSQHFSASSHS